jgi:1,4-alpha-glucan branching enzyme
VVEHVLAHGFTHVELLPVMEHPFYGSCGYQVSGFFAPSVRYGKPEDLMFFVDYLHRHGVGVFVDWVPAHFPSDGHSLRSFDGTPLFEHEAAAKQPHNDGLMFDYGRPEVRSFLLSSALFWLERYHIDGLRVDGVAMMLYREPGKSRTDPQAMRPHGHENTEAVAFLQRLNELLYERSPDTQTVAEETTAWAQVSHPTTAGGLGFGLKWDVGFMHDMLAYLAEPPERRKHRHQSLTFRATYAFKENYVLPLSHDVVGAGQRSLLGRMPGDLWQQLASLRALFAYMWALPGKKLSFMGAELGQRTPWHSERSLDWHLAQDPMHHGMQDLITQLNFLYRSEPALHALDTDAAGFEWVIADDAENCVVSFERHARSQEPDAASHNGKDHDKDKDLHDSVLVVANFSPVLRQGYRVGVKQHCFWREMLNTEAIEYGGCGAGNAGGMWSDEWPLHGRPHSLCLTLPPNSVLYFQAE